MAVADFGAHGPTCGVSLKRVHSRHKWDDGRYSHRRTTESRRPAEAPVLWLKTDCDRRTFVEGPPMTTVDVLGVDDVALRREHRY
ncbi:hypothetical protein [Rhodococcus globerulus]|uniref:Transposase n=1 Tax=Rhodococcus globerulus TaxID=33008 RepID=A0ABU4C537_RHOGO|nr:hypothetical protein [Rhodococcus globerulus]MDV6271389.1 hypothetical protein [Rhodococcus globerulus]